MANLSLGKLLVNLLVALARNNPHLGAAAKDFKQLGYRLERLDHEMKIQSGRSIKPDMTLSSAILGNTLVIEWTEHGNPLSKEDQFQRYCELSREDLRTTGGLAVERTRSHDICTFVLSKYQPEYSQYIAEKFPDQIPSFGCESENSESLKISKDATRLSNDHADEWFSQRLEFPFIPTHYIPFSPDRHKEEELCRPIISGLLSIAAKGGAKSKSADEICEVSFPAVWLALNHSTKKLICRDVKKLLLHIEQDPALRFANTALCSRTQQSPSRFKIRSLKRSRALTSDKLQMRIDDYVFRYHNSRKQLSLFPS